MFDFWSFSEVVAHMHVLYHPLFQIMHVHSWTDQLGTMSLGMIRIIIRGLKYNHYNPPTMEKGNNSREQWYA